MSDHDNSTNETSDPVAKFNASLDQGADYGSAMAQLVADITQPMVAKTIAPFEDRENARQTAAVMEAFEETHPDWKEHEPAMLELAEKLHPKGSWSEQEYLDHLYRTVTRANRAATPPRAEPAEREEIERPSRPESASIRDCYLAAKRGERWDD